VERREHLEAESVSEGGSMGRWSYRLQARPFWRDWPDGVSVDKRGGESEREKQEKGQGKMDQKKTKGWGD
jgi:hypothetical protein